MTPKIFDLSLRFRDEQPYVKASLSGHEPSLYYRRGPNDWRTPSGLQLNPKLAESAESMLSFVEGL